MSTAVQIPNMNPTGVIGSGYGNQPMVGQQGTSFSGTGGPGTMGFGNSTNPNPSMSSTNPYMQLHANVSMTPGGTASPSTTVGANGQVTSNPNSFNQTQRQENRTLGELQTYYGEGMGSLIYQYLQSGGGYNSAITQQAVDSQVNAMGEQIQLGANNLTSMLGAMGVSGSSSEMGNALGNYMNTAMTQENAITSQEFYNMWNASQDRELSMLSQVANVNAVGTANQSSWEDYLGDALTGGLSGLLLADSKGNSMSKSNSGSSGMSPQMMQMLMAA